MTKSKDQQTLAVTVRVGELLFQFNTFEQLVAKAVTFTGQAAEPSLRSIADE